MSKGFVEKSLSVSPFKGVFSEYHSADDPSPRQKTPQEHARDLTFSPIEELVCRYS